MGTGTITERLQLYTGRILEDTLQPQHVCTTMSNKVQVNGASSGVEPALQSQITTALLQNGGVKRIQDTLKQRLDEEGWSENLRNHVTAMFRSGEAITYDDAMAKVVRKELMGICELDK